jgi:hypothetical protein
MNAKGKGTERSEVKSSSRRGDRKKPYDRGQQKTGFFDTSKSKEKDEPTRTHHNKDQALIGVHALLQEKHREKILGLQCSKPNHLCGICNAGIMAMSSRKLVPFGRRNGSRIPLTIGVLLNCILVTWQKQGLVQLLPSH